MVISDEAQNLRTTKYLKCVDRIHFFQTMRQNRLRRPFVMHKKMVMIMDTKFNNKETQSQLPATKLLSEKPLASKDGSLIEMKKWSAGNKLQSCLYMMTIIIAAIPDNTCAIHEHLCLEDDYTNDLPIFIEKRTICNYDTSPVHVYHIKITPDTDYETKLCLKGEFAETFNINKDNELELCGRLEQTETNLKLQIIRTANDIVGTPGERRQAINAIQFILAIEDCNQVSWQTIVVAILSSCCVALMSTLAIMLILYQQKGLIKTGGNDEGGEERSEETPSYANNNLRDETFINPRRTLSYEFNSLSKHSESTLERTQESEKL